MVLDLSLVTSGFMLKVHTPRVMSCYVIFGFTSCLCDFVTRVPLVN